MNRWALFATITCLVVVVVILVLLFPAALEMIDAFAGELRFVWWVVLLLALGLWLIFVVGKKK